MCILLEKEVKFVFDEQCIWAFEALKKNLVGAPILISPNWDIPFVPTCDTSDVVVREVLGRNKDGIFH